MSTTIHAHFGDVRGTRCDRHLRVGLAGLAGSGTLLPTDRVSGRRATATLAHLKGRLIGAEAASHFSSGS